MGRVDSVGMDMQRDRQVSCLAAAGMLGAGLFALSVAVMHVVQPGLSAVDDAVSFYLNGAWGWVLGAGLVAVGAGSLCLAAAIGRREEGARVGIWALGLWGVGAILGGLFAPDPMGSWGKPPSFSGMVHSGAAMLAFLSFPVGAVRLSGRLGRGLSMVAWVCVALLLVFFVTLLPVFSHHAPHGLGVAERLVLGAYVVWLMMAGWSVRRG